MDADGGEGQHMTAVLMPMRSEFWAAQREPEPEQPKPDIADIATEQTRKRLRKAKAA